jgi:D-3-phosphoglycerate dehydrogenase
MENFRILITDGLQDIGKEILSKESHVDDHDGISAQDLINEVNNCDALIVRGRTKVTSDVIAAGKKLKVIGRSGVGVDNIDLKAAKDKGIIVVNAPSSTSIAVAELAMGLIFALSREIPRADAATKRGEWIKKELEGTELNGKTLGVIGFGRIGSAVGRMAVSVGMHVLGCDIIKVPETNRIPGSEILSIDEVIRKSDFITIHTPLTDETRGMINADTISKMKDGVYLVCTARGGIIDEKALLEALNSGKVAGAALDVFEKEPPANTELVSHPHLIVTPHIGAQTGEAQLRASADIAREVLTALKGEELHWRVA